MNPTQLRHEIIEPALQILGEKYASESAIKLLLATSAQESHCGEYVVQIGGPARGIFQMEPATLHDLYVSFLFYHADLQVKLGREDSARLVYDWRYATQCARLEYWRYPEALPEPGDVDAMFALYKQRWNSSAGAATREQFGRNWEHYVR